VPVQSLLVLARRSQRASTRNRPGGGAFAACQLAQGHVHALPYRRDLARQSALDPDPLRAGDAQKRSVLNGHCASDQDVAFDLALAKSFFVVAALGIAVVELADRGVTPVHDGNARARIGEGGAADEHVALHFASAGHAFTQTQVPEIRREGIHQHGLQIRAVSETSCKRSIWAMSAGTSSSRASPISSRKAINSSS